MTSAETYTDSSTSHPFETLQDLAFERGWMMEQPHPNQMSVRIPGRWVEFNLFFNYDDDNLAIQTSCVMTLNSPCEDSVPVRELLTAVNEDLWMGHFEIMRDPAFPLYRHTLPLRGTPGIATEQLEDLVDEAITACERYYPAFQMVVERGRPARDALHSAIIHTEGEA